MAGIGDLTLAQIRKERFAAALPVELEKGFGITCDISASGVFFETDAPVTPGNALNFSLDFSDAPGGPLRLVCQGLVVRVEERGGKIGVGASITNYRFERADSKPMEPA